MRDKKCGNLAYINYAQALFINFAMAQGLLGIRGTSVEKLRNIEVKKAIKVKIIKVGMV